MSLEWDEFILCHSANDRWFMKGIRGLCSKTTWINSSCSVPWNIRIYIFFNRCQCKIITVHKTDTSKGMNKHAFKQNKTNSMPTDKQNTSPRRHEIIHPKNWQYKGPFEVRKHLLPPEGEGVRHTGFSSLSQESTSDNVSSRGIRAEPLDCAFFNVAIKYIFLTKNVFHI